MFRALADDLKRADELVALVASAGAFFDLGHLGAVVRWANQADVSGGPYRVEAGTIMGANGSMSIPSFDLAIALVAPTFRSAIGGS